MEWSSKYHPNLYTLDHSNGCGGKGQLCATRTADFATSCTKMRNMVTSPWLMTHLFNSIVMKPSIFEIWNESIWRSKHETFKDDDSLRWHQPKLHALQRNPSKWPFLWSLQNGWVPFNDETYWMKRQHLTPVGQQSSNQLSRMMTH